jgi:hypothetical protein
MKKIKQKAVEYLTDLEMSHKKSKFLHHTDQMQEYLKTEGLTIKKKQMLFKMRNRMFPNKTDFSNLFKGYDLAVYAMTLKLRNLKVIFCSAHFCLITPNCLKIFPIKVLAISDNWSERSACAARAAL